MFSKKESKKLTDKFSVNFFVEKKVEMLADFFWSKNVLVEIVGRKMFDRKIFLENVGIFRKSCCL